MTVPSFTFKNATTTQGTVAGGEAAQDFLHPLLPTHLGASNGFLLMTNGWNLNRRMADVTGYDGTAGTAVQMLQMRPPREAVLPAVGWMGAGRVFGRDFFWRYRLKDSRTGEHSGLSPLPSVLTNLGTEQPPGGTTYLGQNAYFRFTVANYEARADTLELFRCASQEPGVVYLVKSVTLTGQTYVDIVDDVTDEEIIVRDFVSAAQPSGPTWQQGILYPVVKSWSDPVGRTMYYGIRRFGARRLMFSGVTVSLTPGTDLLTLSTGSASILVLLEPGRIGQRVQFYATADLADPIDDPTVYRIAQWVSATTFRVTPEIVASTDVPSGTATAVYMAIVDDRDARVSYMSEPGKPWLIDPRNGIATGDDYDDGVMAWFSLDDGTVYCQTRRRIYAALNYQTLDPSQSVQFVVRSNEGTVGFEAGCKTPAGWVFVNERRGPRLFTGSATMPLDADSSPFRDFKAVDQFTNFDQAALESVVCAYDAEHHAVVISYVPSGGSTLRETLTFHLDEGVWRGGNRDRVCAAGLIRTTTSDDAFVTGDDFGNLMVREEQALDVTPANSAGGAMIGTIASVQTTRIFTATGCDFNGDSDERYRGSPVWFQDPATGAYYFSRIADILSTTQVELDGPPVADDNTTTAVLAVGWTFGLGSIRWEAITAYVGDLGEPILPKIAQKLAVRFRRGTSSQTFEVGCADDCDGTYYGEQTDAATPTAAQPTQDTNATIYGEMALVREGAAFQIRLRGTSRTGDPQIGGAVLLVQISGGTLP